MLRNPLKPLLSSKMSGKLSLSTRSRTVVLPSAHRTTEDVKAALEDLLTNPSICSTRLDNMLVHSKHSCLFPLLKKVVMSRKKWDRFELVDTMELPKYEAWSGLQFDMQEEYELSYYVHHKNCYLQEISWVAQVKLPKGTCVQDILAFFRHLLADNCIYHVTVTGFSDSTAPRVLQSFANAMTRQLATPVMICVASNWWKSDATEWRAMVEACYKALAATVHHPALGGDQQEIVEPMKDNSLISVATAVTMMESRELDEEDLHWRVTACG
jgi:hypothetical protein